MGFPEMSDGYMGGSKTHDSTITTVRAIARSQHMKTESIELISIRWEGSTSEVNLVRCMHGPRCRPLWAWNVTYMACLCRPKQSEQQEQRVV